jgi:hypothetical protein
MLDQFYKPKQFEKMKETELAQSVITWLQGQHWDVYQEVMFDHGSGVADIVAVRNNILWIIECKTSYCLDVLEQAARWGTHYRSVAVPSSRSQRNLHVAEFYYKVGVIYVRGNDVQEMRTAPMYLHGTQGLRAAKRYKTALLELHKTYAPAGSKGGRHLTPYKLTMMEVRKVIENNPGCSIGFLYDQLGKMHYASKQSFMGSLLDALDKFEDWCKVDKTSKPYKLFAQVQP